MVLKKLIVGGNHVKGTHLNAPELRKKQGPATRKHRAGGNQSGWKKPGGKRQSDAALLPVNFCRNANSTSPSSVARATPHPSEL